MHRNLTLIDQEKEKLMFLQFHQTDKYLIRIRIDSTQKAQQSRDEDD